MHVQTLRLLSFEFFYYSIYIKDRVLEMLLSCWRNKINSFTSLSKDNLGVYRVAPELNLRGDANFE